MTDAIENILSKFQLIPISKVKPSRHQARKVFNEESLKGLAESIKQEGLIEPIVVRQIGDEYELISGERRLRACKLNGAETIEAKIIQPISEAESAAKGLIENIQRENLNPVDEAEGFKELNQLDPAYWTQARIGQIAGRSESFVSRSLDILGLPDLIKVYLRARKYSRSHALELLRLSSPEKQLEASKVILEKHLSWEATRELIDGMTANEPKTKKDKDKFVDPFGGNWTTLKKDPTLIKATWSVHYAEKDNEFIWQIKVALPGSIAIQELPNWLIHFGKSLK